MSGPFVCSVCGNSTVYVTERLEKRIEYRRLSDQGRQFVRKVAEICTPCARAELAEARPQDHTAFFPFGG